MRLNLFVLLAVWLVGCASSIPRGMQGNKDFPSPVELDEMTRVDPVRRSREYGQKMVEQWRLTPPLSDVISYRTRDPQDALERRLVEASSRAEEPKISEGASCYARQLGLFYAEHKAYPHEGLKSFMSSRCGMSVSRALTLTWRAPTEQVGQGAQAVVARFGDDLARHAEEQIVRGGSYELGVWSGVHEDHTLVTMVVSRRYVALEPISARAGEDGEVVLRGESLHTRWVDVSAMYTVGDFAHEACTSEEGVKAPRFVLRCKLSRGDRDARLDLWGTNEGRVLSSGISDLVLWPQIEPSEVYQAPLVREVLQEVKLDPEASLLAQLLTLVNHVRSQGGLKPLGASQEQSAVLGKIAPHFFEAPDTAAGDELEDKLARGFLSGWSVGKPILDAGFVTGGVQRRDIVQWLSATLETAGGRRTLLSPDNGLLALGTYAQGDAYSFLAVRYSTPPDETYAQRLTRLARLINRARRDAGVPGVVWDRHPEEIEEEVAEMERAEMGLEVLMRDFAWKASMRFAVKENHTFITPLSEGSKMPDFLIAPERRKIDALVALYPIIEGHPWQTYIVFVLADK